MTLILEKNIMISKKVTCMASGRVSTEEEGPARRENYSARSRVEVVACDAPACAPGLVVSKRWEDEGLVNARTTRRDNVKRMATHFFRSHSNCSSLLTGPGMT